MGHKPTSDTGTALLRLTRIRPSRSFTSLGDPKRWQARTFSRPSFGDFSSNSRSQGRRRRHERNLCAVIYQHFECKSHEADLGLLEDLRIKSSLKEPTASPEQAFRDRA